MDISVCVGATSIYLDNCQRDVDLSVWNNLAGNFKDADKDTRIFGTIFVSTFAALALGAPSDQTVVAGFGFSIIYTVSRWVLVKVRIKEHEAGLIEKGKRSSQALIKKHANPQLQQKLDEVAKPRKNRDR